MATPADMLARLMAEQMQKTGTPTDDAETTAAPVEQSNQTAEIIRLPVWPDSVRGLPNTVLRSALFGAIKRGPRNFQQGREVATIQGVKILFTGPQLDQADLDVWMQCLHLARTEGVGCRIEFSFHGFLKSIGRANGGKNSEWLLNAFRRLTASVVEITDGKNTYLGPLIHHAKRNEETGYYAIEINPAINALFSDTGWTQVEFDQRMALKRQPLAQWLHGFYSTHAKPYPMKVSTLHELCGSETQQMKHFRSELKKALTKLNELSGWEWQIDSKDLVHIKKTPSASQQRHLIKKGKGTA